VIPDKIRLIGVVGWVVEVNYMINRDRLSYPRYPLNTDSEIVDVSILIRVRNMAVALSHLHNGLYNR